MSEITDPRRAGKIVVRTNLLMRKNTLLSRGRLAKRKAAT
jgi:hypothetical protein